MAQCGRKTVVKVPQNPSDRTLFILGAASFVRFTATLEAPLNSAVVELLARRAPWERRGNRKAARP